MENILFENYSNDLVTLFNKVSIYNKNVMHSLKENRTYDYNVLFNISERQTISNIGKSLTFHLFADYLNKSSEEQLRNLYLDEGFLDWAKNKKDQIADKLSSLWDKVKNWGVEQWNSVMTKIGGKFTKIWGFLSKLIQSKVATVKDFLKITTELFASISDRLSSTLETLGLFGANAISDDDFATVDNYIKNIKESADTLTEGQKALQSCKEFIKDSKTYYIFGLLCEYISMHLNSSAIQETHRCMFAKERSLNEDNALRNFFAKHKFLSMFMANEWKGKKVPWYTSLIISLAGAVIIYIAGGIFVTGSGPLIILICSIVWGARSFMAVMIKRKIQLRPGEKYWNDWRFLLSAILTAGICGYTIYHQVQNYIAAKLSDEAARAFASASEKLAEFQREHPNATLQEAEEWLNQNPELRRFLRVSAGDTIQSSTVIEPTTTEIDAWKEYASDQMQGISSNSDWNNALMNLDKKPPFEVNISLNVKAAGGQTSFANSDEFFSLLKKYSVPEEDIHFINFTSSVGGQTTYGKIMSSNNEIVGSDDFIKDLREAIKTFGNGTGNATSIGSGAVQKVVTTLAQFTMSGFAPIATSLQAIGACFDFLGRDNGYMVAILGNEKSHRTPYLITDIDKELTIDEVKRKFNNNEVISSIINNERQIIVTPENKNVVSVIKKSDIPEVEPIRTREKVNVAESLLTEATEEIQAQNAATIIQQFKETANLKNHKYILWSGIHITERDYNKYLVDGDPEDIEDWIDKNKKNTIPFLLMAPFSMMCYDISIDEDEHNKVPYPFKGLQNNLTVKPLLNKDKGTKEYVAKMYRELIKNSLNIMLNAHPGAVQEQNGKYVPGYAYKSTSSTPRFDLGCLSVDDICKILNKENDAYRYSEPQEAPVLRTDGKTVMLDKDKEALAQSMYVRTYIWPKVSNTSTAVYKEILEYANKSKEFKNLFFKPHSDELSEEKFMKFEKFFRTSMASFYKNLNQSTIGKIKRKTLEWINGVGLTDEEKMESKDLWKHVAAMAHIIWKYKYDDSQLEPVDTSQKALPDGQKRLPEGQKRLPEPMKVLPQGKTAEEIKTSTTYRKYEKWYNNTVLPMIFPDERSKSGKMTEKTIYKLLPDDFKGYSADKLKGILANPIIIFFMAYAVHTGAPSRKSSWWSLTRLKNILNKFKVDCNQFEDEELEYAAKTYYKYYAAILKGLAKDGEESGTFKNSNVVKQRIAESDRAKFMRNML